MPKGGGAIRGIGEKFAANPVKGTASISVPLATSPGRAGFGPQLALTYDSGAGNTAFGFGWSLGLPSITRKTEKGLPRYADADDSDVFILSGGEDLVPQYRQSTGIWLLDAHGNLVVDEDEIDGYRVRRFRPRIEGLFARIERWTRVADALDVHWRTISKHNVLTVYGGDANSRIVDPEHGLRIFSWLICETRDDKGNATLFRYKAEDGVGVDSSRAHESNRGLQADLRRTANRYLKRLYYGNRTPLLEADGHRPRFLDKAAIDAQIANGEWMFEAVFDYGEHDAEAPAPNDNGAWLHRADAFSTYRSGFEIRTTRLCHRFLMFHHFDDEPGVGRDCLVRSTDFTFSHQQDPASIRNPIYTFLLSVTHSGYQRTAVGYRKRSLPPVEYAYSEPLVHNSVADVDAESLEHLPIGVEGSAYQWIDLHGEGIPGILTEQGGAWFYKRNISPISEHAVEFAPVEHVVAKPNLALAGGQAQFMDLSGDGRPDLVVMDGPVAGVSRHDDHESWQPFRPFTSRLTRDMRDPNMKLLDLDGDGHADVLVSEHGVFVWHPSLADHGFAAARRVQHALDDEDGPRMVFADGTQSIYLADLNGDGLTDLVRIRNAEVCYWPNLGHGRFGAKVSMDHAPQFDNVDQFDQARIRLADIDGSGTTDLIYIHRDGVRLYFNQCGNSWSSPRLLQVTPRVDDLVTIVAADIAGNGTACLVWSSPLPGDARRQMRYVDLMGGQKPHLLRSISNNLGAETHIQYASSTKFYLQDKRDGKPWITRLPFPVHVVERVETADVISRNRFVSRYRYHHGYFDGDEREFRGFGMVEQWDTEELAALVGDSALPPASNVDAASHVPPVHTKTWFHTGVYIGGDHVSDFFAGLLDSEDAGEYYREPGLTDGDFRSMLLLDSMLPNGLAGEEREACRALKGVVLRQEIYALDGSDREAHPYTVTEQNFTIRYVQPRDRNRHAVFFTHPHEVVTHHYERNPADPRVQHAITLEVDGYGSVLKDVAIGYGRRQPDTSLLPVDQGKQTQTLITYTESRVTNAIDDGAADPDAYRVPVLCEARTFELTGYAPTDAAGRFRYADFVEIANGQLTHAFDAEIAYEDVPTGGRQRRLIEAVRTLYRPDDLGSAQGDVSRLLPFGTAERLTLPGEHYKLAFTPGLLNQVFQRNGEALLANAADVLGGQGGDRGGYLPSQLLKADGRFPATDADDHWWIPSGRVFLSPANSTPAQELAHARTHFFLPHRSRDPFHSDAVSTETVATYDPYDLLILDTRDAVGNRVTAGERLSTGDLDPATRGNDYRMLKTAYVTDANGNRSQVVFDTLGLVVGTAVMGKREESVGDRLDDTFDADLDETTLLAHLADPFADPQAIIGDATTRLMYDLFAYQRTKDQADPQPAVVYTLARETHHSEAVPGGGKLQHAFAYSDGFGREIQKKTQAARGPVDAGASDGPRWVASGWTILNNKGKPVRQYEPFFTATHRFEFGVEVGVSPIVFYDPLERVIATLYPNHAYDKFVFDPWRQAAWDVNDTVLSDPRTDDDVKATTARCFASLTLVPGEPWQTWHAQRQGGALGAQEQSAASKAAAHANTPTIGYVDTLGRPFITLAHSGFNDDTTPIQFATRTELDIEGNQRSVRDAITQSNDTHGRITMQCAYDLLGNRIHQVSMEAGSRWLLNDAAGHPLRAWDSRGHRFRTEYDPLHRPLRTFVRGADAARIDFDVLTERVVYGEQHPNAEVRNLRGAVFLHLDQAGVVVFEAHDFKGNLTSASRRLSTEYNHALDWRAVDASLPVDAAAPVDLVSLAAILAPVLESDVYASTTTYDALNRPTALTTPHSAGMQPNVIRPAYNEANAVDRIDAVLSGAQQNGELMWTPFVTTIAYDARGRRERIDYANGVTTTYTYDAATFRLVHLYTRRGASFTEDCQNPHPPPPTIAAPDLPLFDTPCGLQNLHYTYDPVGNITHVRDQAQPTIYFRNQRVEPTTDYRYDAVYRLIEATGREHLGQIAGAPVLHSHSDVPRVGLEWSPNDGQALGTYTERYIYDAVGNFLEMQHRGSDPAHPGWTRTYEYGESSLIEDGSNGHALKTSGRLTKTVIGNQDVLTERYVHDAHGNVTRMPHLGGAHPAANMHWDYRDQLRQADLGGGGTAHFVYDSAGQRVRKVWQKPGNIIEERIYFSGFDIFRRQQGATRLERETVHLTDDRQRIALIETRTVDTAGDDPAPAVLVRYQLGNHLGSASVELDDQAQIISYEEYTPYGSTSCQAVRSGTQTPKRYRYTGKERDEESGFYYHGARYYAPWIGRWISADPVGIAADGLRLYVYVRASPIVMHDPSGLDDELIHWNENTIEHVPSGDILHQGQEYLERYNPSVADRQLVAFGESTIIGYATPPPPAPKPKPAPPPAEPIVPFDPMAESPFASWLLYQKDSSVLDAITDDSNLEFAQDFCVGVAIVAGTIATGGMLLKGAAAAGYSATVAGMIAGGGSSSFSLGARSMYSGTPVTADQAAQEIGLGMLLGGGAARLGQWFGGLKGRAPSSGGAPAPKPAPAPAARAAAPSRVEETGFGGWRATWSGDPKALVAFEQHGAGGISVGDIFRGTQPAGTGGQMLADSLKAVGQSQPTVLRFSGIINEPTLEALARGTAPANTLLGKALAKAVDALGGRITGWTTGVHRGKTWIEAAITY